ncbi:MAG TPA: phosphodiester glycosidase family protein [Gaiellaceae bacterium]|nr:phosphodiester glycosidase family protein [Gaiellaceae bacterium]
MLKRGLLPAALAVALASPAFAGAATLMPGVTYTRDVRMVGSKPVVVHVVRTPRHGGNHRLRPVLSHGTVLGRQTVPDMQRDLSRRATTVGVNGDFFRLDRGWPSGLFLRDGVMATRPNKGRSALGIAFDGSLLVDRFGFAGSWRTEAAGGNRVHQVNRALEVPHAVGLFTPAWGGQTPRRRRAVEVVLRGFPKALVNGFLTGTVTAVRRGGGTWVPPDGAVLQARGRFRRDLRREAPRGTAVTVSLRVPNLPDDVADAIGGGPALVANGAPLRQTDEWFTLSQLLPRHPRSAVGQLPGGRIIFVVADGRSPISYGLTNWELARLMASLGAETAMAFDGGGSATLAFDGRVLNRPSDGPVRPVATGLFVHYYGVYAPPVPAPPLSPNGDGVADSKVLAAKLVRRSSVVARLLRPNGSVAWRFEGVVRRGRIRHAVGGPRMAEGAWRWVVDATEVRSGRTSTARRGFRVNKTLGHLRLSRERLRIGKGRRGTLGVRVRLAHAASLAATVRSPSGRTVRVLVRGDAAAGAKSWRWNGRNRAGRLVGSGTYTVRVAARNGLGRVQLAQRLRVVRVRRG